MSDLGYAFANLPQPLLNYRWHGANVSVLHQETQARNAILAHFAHRVRKAGLPDPLEGAETIDAELMQAMPAHLLPALDAGFFVHHHNQLSLADRKKLYDAWRHYSQLDTQAQRDTYMCVFLDETSEGRNASTRLPYDPASHRRGFSPAPEGDLQLIMAKVKGRCMLDLNYTCQIFSSNQPMRFYTCR